MQWFCEKILLGKKTRARLMIPVERKIFSTKSPFQKIDVLETLAYGRILVLDGAIQLSRKDEFIYHEMLAHTSLFYHPNPKKVLIIGGGDGGILREVLKHPISEAYLCEIDRKVVEVSKKYLPFVARGAFNNKRVKIYFEDGTNFIKKFKNYFDVIIVDTTDPSDLSFPLLTQGFYSDLKMALRKMGIVAVQSGGLETFWKWIKRLSWLYEKNFDSLKLHRFNVPSYLEAEWTMLVGGKNIKLEGVDINVLKTRFKAIKNDLKYYSPEIHYFSGILPKYLKNRL